MPVTAIPFKSPAPFELPDYLVESLTSLPFEEATKQVLEILRDAGCADLLLTATVDASGRLHAGPRLAGDERLAEVAQEIEDELAMQALSVESVEGRQSFFGQAIHAGSPLLMMGEVAEGEADPFPGALRRYLRAGLERNNLGFLYVFPLINEAGEARGAVALHRSLASGPLNHDQPAITHSLLFELGKRL
ncbi:MAG: hypothetical protein ACLGIN_04085 [Candidatus Sericytochromatia bacterium]